MSELVGQAWRYYSTANERQVDFGDGIHVRGSKARVGRDGFAVHVERYTDGQAASVVSFVGGDDIPTGLKMPANDENFQTSEAIAILKGNYLFAYNGLQNASNIAGFFKNCLDKLDSHRIS